jgi:hypothetical protein
MTDSVIHLLRGCYVSYKIRKSQGHTIYSRIMLYQVPWKFEIGLKLIAMDAQKDENPVGGRGRINPYPANVEYMVSS